MDGEFDQIRQFKPWHDVGVKIEGVVVRDMVETYLERWHSYCDQYYVRVPEGC